MLKLQYAQQTPESLIKCTRSGEEADVLLPCKLPREDQATCPWAARESRAVDKGYLDQPEEVWEWWLCAQSLRDRHQMGGGCSGAPRMGHAPSDDSVPLILLCYSQQAYK